MLKELFVSEVRLNILKLMLPHPDKPLHVRAIVRAVDTEINAVRRELSKLTSIGLFKKRQSSNRLYYTVDTSHMYYSELLSLISKEIGLGEQIIKNKKQLGDINYAVMSIKFAKNSPTTMLDVDLFLVGSVNFNELEKIIKENEIAYKREIHYSVMGHDEFTFRKRRNDQFVTKILTQGRIMLIGDEMMFCEV